MVLVVAVLIVEVWRKVVMVVVLVVVVEMVLEVDEVVELMMVV